MRARYMCTCITTCNISVLSFFPFAGLISDSSNCRFPLITVQSTLLPNRAHCVGRRSQTPPHTIHPTLELLCGLVDNVACNLVCSQPRHLMEDEKRNENATKPFSVTTEFCNHVSNVFKEWKRTKTCHIRGRSNKQWPLSSTIKSAAWHVLSSSDKPRTEPQ